MNIELKITFTDKQIIAAAQKIAANDDSAWETTPEQYLTAVRNYLACCISDIVSDADWYANKDNFSVEKQYTPSFCDEADDLILPDTPEWAKERIDGSTAIVQRRELTPEPDGNILYA